MNRYIDADLVKINYIGGFKDTFEIDYDSFMNAPTVDIVQCRECRKVREGGGHTNCNGYLYCRKWKTLVDEDDFCSWGERRG